MLPSLRLGCFLKKAPHNRAIREYASLSDPGAKTWKQVGAMADSIFSAVSLARGPIGQKMTLRQLLTGVPTEGLFDIPAQWRDFGDLKKQGHVGYLGLIWALRSLEKVDRHCHISSGLHESEIAWSMIQNPALLEQMLERLEPDNKNPANKKAAKIEAIRQASLAGDQQTLTGLLDDYKPLARWKNKDFFVVNFDLLGKAVKRTVVRMLSDGVVSLELRLNPIKPELFPPEELAGKDDAAKIGYICQKTMTVVNRAIDEAVAEAEQDYGAKPAPARIRVLFSFDRSKDYKELFPNLPKVQQVVEAVLNNLPADPRIAGIDISGMEYSPQDEDHAPKNWGRAFQLAAQKDLLVTTHLGDMSFITPDGSPGLSTLNDAARADNSKFIDLYREHLGFFEGFVDLLPVGARIGHAFTLHPAYLTYAWPILIEENEGDDAKSWANLADPGQDTNLGSRIRGVRAKIMDKNIMIEHCPSAAVSADKNDSRGNEITRYQHLPVYHWLEQGLKVCLGIDGIWHTGSRPRSLSEELARVIVASPSDLTLGTILSLVS